MLTQQSKFWIQAQNTEKFPADSEKVPPEPIFKYASSTTTFITWLDVKF